MILTPVQTLICIAAIVVGVQVSRWLPFLAFSDRRELPQFVKYLGRVLPPALMGLIVVYCFKNVEILTGNHGLPELIATAVVIGTYAWSEKLLLSVANGTVVYMVLVQLVFA